MLQAAEFVENPVSLEIFDEAVGLYRRARKHGLTIRSSVDCLIGACALRHNLTVISHDRDFGALAKVSELRHMAV